MRRPSIPPVIPGFEAGKGIVSYKRKGNDYLAAFFWMVEPRWLLVVEKPLHAILEPINTIKTAAWTIALGLFVLVWLVSGLAMRPILAGLRACMGMVRQVGDGDLTARSVVRSGDDIGKLAAGLNHMADHLQKQREKLLESERKYRGLFENAVEGIFQTREDGTVVAANPAMLEIVGAPSLEGRFKRLIRAHSMPIRSKEGLCLKCCGKREESINLNSPSGVLTAGPGNVGYTPGPNLTRKAASR